MSRYVQCQTVSVFVITISRADVKVIKTLAVPPAKEVDFWNIRAIYSCCTHAENRALNQWDIIAIGAHNL